MTLRRRLAWLYAGVVTVCLMLLAGLAHHEFIVEPGRRKALGIPELPEDMWSEYAEVFFYSMIPVVFSLGWWLMRRMLLPIDTLAGRVEKMHADNLCEPLPRTFNGDEVDRLTEVFNALAGRLQRSIAQIREFTLHASHELKTPLTVMHAQLNSALLSPSMLAMPEERRLAESQLDEVRRLARIVDTLSLLVKADVGLVDIERSPVRLDELVHECFEDAKVLAQPEGVQAGLPVCEKAALLGDRDRLRQMLLNLIDNAIKYNRAGGFVTLSLRADGTEAEVRVENTGEGIPPEILPRIFDRFVRGPEAGSRAIKGSGLGLVIVKWIVESHGGTIRVESKPGGTTIFQVRLPVVVAAPEKPAGENA